MTREEFDNIIKENKTVLFDFNAVWCGPCQAMAPIIDEIKEENKDINVTCVDCDESRDLAISLRIMNIPTFLIYKNGELSRKIVGMVSKEELLKEIL